MGLLKRLVKDCWPVFAFFLLIYVLLFTRGVLMDIPEQMCTLRDACMGKVALPPTALFYLLAWVAALGQYQSKICLGLGAAIACAGLLSLRWWVTRYIFNDYFQNERSPNRAIFGWIAGCLAIVCSLPTLDWLEKGWYIIGQPSPNYWMNGTLLASWPFALILFWQSYRQLQRPEVKWIPWMVLWLLLLLVSKPSYALVFVMVFPLFLLGRQGLSRVSLGLLLPIVALGLALVLEYYLVFLQEDSVYVKRYNDGQQSGAMICLFCVWRMFSPNILFSVLMATLFPISVAVLYWQDLRKKLLFWYAWAGFFAALAISAAVAQTGNEFSCWNFRWQHYIAAYLLFMVSALFVWENIQAETFRLTFRPKIVFSVFALHLISGFVYLGKMWYTQNHY